MPSFNDSMPFSEFWKAFDSLPARKWRKNQMIYLQGDPADSFYYLKEGKVQVFLSSAAGDEKILTLLSPGSLFGEAAFLDGLPRMSSARAMEDAQIISVGKGDLVERIRRQPELAMAMLGYLSRTVRMLSGQVDGMAFLQAGPRVAQILLRLAAGSPNGSVSCSHEELAGLAGVSRVTVSRALSEFAQKGWIVTGYRAIQIKSPRALARYASAGSGTPPFS